MKYAPFIFYIRTTKDGPGTKGEYPLQGMLQEAIEG